MKNNQEKLAKYGFWTALLTFLTSLLDKIFDLLGSQKVMKAASMERLDPGIITEYAAAPDLTNIPWILILSFGAVLFFGLWRMIEKNKKKGI